jgi:hypothetical protein
MAWGRLWALLFAAALQLFAPAVVDAARTPGGTCPSGSPDISVANSYDLEGAWSSFYVQNPPDPYLTTVPPTTTVNPGAQVHFDRLDSQVWHVRFNGATIAINECG